MTADLDEAFGLYLEREDSPGTTSRFFVSLGAVICATRWKRMCRYASRVEDALSTSGLSRSAKRPSQSITSSSL